MESTFRILFKRAAIGALMVAVSLTVNSLEAAQGLRPWEDPARVRQLLFEAR